MPSFKDIIVINLVVMSYKAEFSVISTKKLKDNSVGDIDSEAPDLVSLGVQFFNSQGGVKRVIFEKFCLVYGLFLNRLWKFSKEPVEGCCGGDFHLFIFKKLREGFSFCNAALFMVFLREGKKFDKLFPVKSSSVTEGFKGIFAYLQVNTFRSLPGNSCFQFVFHKSDTSQYSYTNVV